MMSNKLDIIGIDIDIIIILVPISILLAIAPSPESLQMLTANSDRNAIPVIFNSNDINVPFIDVLFANDCIKLIIPSSSSIINKNISTPVNKLMYMANSGLYCFNSIIIISAINAIPIIFITSTFELASYKLNIVLIVSNSVLISLITIVKTITSPAKVVIIA